jgi:primosomal protein N' (replication factor Y) (superfamily II helicase)
LYLPKVYTWAVPAAFNAVVKGSWVEVSLRNKRYAGIIKEIVAEAPDGFDALPIDNVLEYEPIVTTEQLQLWQWIAQWYYCTEGEVMNAALPNYFKLTSESILVYNADAGDNFAMLSDDAFLIAEALLLQTEISYSQIQQIVGKKSIYHIIKELTANSICDVYESIQEKYKPKLESFVRLDAQYEKEAVLEAMVNSFTKAPKQLALLLSFLHIKQHEGEVTKRQLLEKSDATEAQLKGLVDKNILVVEKKPVDRVLTGVQPIAENIQFSAAQQQAYDAVVNAFKKQSVTLLHGITGSGKTPIYAKYLQSIIANGGQALFLLPEITLTAQLIKRLQKYFGVTVALYHSKISNAARYEIWRSVKNGTCKLVVGARSSMFLPFKNLQCIVVDEEHDISYKQQEPAPRYHARDTAIYMASLFGANVLLGSATPSYESYYQAETGKYGFVYLGERFSKHALPPIEVIDAKLIEKKEKGKQFLSSAIQKAIELTLQHKGQVIVFQNRRGHSPYLQCDICNWKPGCKNCKSNLTYHKSKNKLKCHLCNSSYAVVYTCPQCGGKHLSYRNYGTEKIEEILSLAFTKATIKRMDNDSIKGKNDYDALIKQFEERKIDILIGTQMVVKGLDFDNVQLVIIPDGDGLLHFNDIRVYERAFQLIEQVSGRTGRKYKQGTVLLQMYQTKHPLLSFVLKHNYIDLYKQEMQLRKQFFYPPFSRLLKITLKHKNVQTVAEAANFFGIAIKAHFADFMVGPEEPAVNRIQNVYLQELMIKIPKKMETIQFCQKIIHETWAKLLFNKKWARVIVQVNMDVM